MKSSITKIKLINHDKDLLDLKYTAIVNFSEPADFIIKYIIYIGIVYVYILELSRVAHFIG